MPKINAEFQKLIPPLTPEEYEGLEKSILAEGCRDALVVWNNTVVDGHNRYEICEKHGVFYETVEHEFENEGAAKVWIIQNQFARRNLLAYERGRLALKLEEIIAARAKEKQKESGGAVPQKSAKPPIDTRAELARAAGVSHDTIAKVKVIENAGTPEQKEKLRSGDTTINKVYEDIKKKERVKEAEKRRKELEKSVSLAKTSKYELFCGDFESVIEKEKITGVHSIITDPPYPKEYLHLYEKLALTASKILVDGGSLVVMIGQSYLPEIVEMISKHMVYQWTVSYLLPGKTTQIFGRKVLCLWKPVLWFVKGKYQSEWVTDVVKSELPDKNHHEWGQSESGMAALVNIFSQPGDIVLDPFLGAATTGVVAVKNKRRFIGIEIDKATFDAASLRMYEATK